MASLAEDPMLAQLRPRPCPDADDGQPSAEEDGWSSPPSSPRALGGEAARPKQPRQLHVAAFWAACGLATLGCLLALGSLGTSAWHRSRLAAAAGGPVSLAEQQEVLESDEAAPPEDSSKDGKDCHLVEGWMPWVAVFKCPKVEVPCVDEGKDCTRSECCAEPGKQCYKKTEYYASCMIECKEGVHPEDADGEPWTCEKRGTRATGSPTGAASAGTAKPDATASTAASADGEACGEEEFSECTQSKCCADAALTCYSKDDYFAMCRADCIPGSTDPDDERKVPWECTPLGPGNAGQVTAETAATVPGATGAAGASTASGKGGCVGPGEDCSAAGCCTEAGHSCYQKDEGWASCKPTGTCTPGPDPEDENDDPWSCEEVSRRL